MAISVTWDGTTYSIPQSGEFNWSSLTNFLVALGQKAAVAGEMKQEIRKALTSPVTISATSDYAIVTDLTAAGPVTVNLPAGSPGQIFVIVDGKGDASTNNVTINRNGTDTIKSQTSLVLTKDRQVVMLQYNSGDTDWKVINYAIPPGQVTDSDISGVISTAGKVSGSAITSGTIAGSTSLNSSGNVTLTGSGALSVAGTAALNGGVTLGDGSGDALTINSSAASVPNGLNFDSNTLVIDAANNRVGVGIASPTVALDVVGAAKVSTDLTVNGNTVLGDATSDTLTIAGNATQNGVGFLKVASGATADRPGSAVNGMIRYNSDLTAFEGYAANAWSAIGGGGTVDKVTQASHAFAVRDVLYINASGVYVKALATAANTAEVVGVVSRVVDANNFEITLSGEITGLTGLTAGGVYFLSDATAGLATLTEPTTVGYVSVPIGVASSTTSLYIAPKRGYVVGGANARTQISLPNNTTQVVQDVSIYDAGELAGWVYIDATTDLRFYVQAQFVKGGDGNYDLAYQVTGDTPPAGFLMTMSNAGVISITLPSITGYTSAFINYALNAPAVGTNFPLSIDGAAITSGTISAARLPQVSTSSQGAFPSLTSSLDNATATQLGLKQYLHGTNYNGGNAPTVTSAQPGFAVSRAVFIPYQTQDGAWRLRFNINATFTSDVILVTLITVNGVTSKSGMDHSISGFFGGNNNGAKAFWAQNTSSQNMYVGTAATAFSWHTSGDIELQSKPTWAY